jgi:hypothetical protein
VVAAAIPAAIVTGKVHGKTVTESFATPAEQRKAGREMEAFRRYRQLERSFVEVNAQHAVPLPLQAHLV